MCAESGVFGSADSVVEKLDYGEFFDSAGTALGGFQGIGRVSGMVTRGVRCCHRPALRSPDAFKSGAGEDFLRVRSDPQWSAR